MAKYCKLNEEIKQFIIQQKKANPELSCRGMISLIKERFQVNLSKSLINNVIKEQNLSGPVGRRREKEAIILKKPAEAQFTRQEVELMENGGCFFLKAADLKLSLTSSLAQNLLVYFVNLSKQVLQEIIETLIYQPLFKQKRDLWQLIGKETPLDFLTQISQHLARIPLSELNKAVTKLVLNSNINDINELYKKCLLKLNSYVQVNFFPSVYQILDLSNMQERFYVLPARIEKKPRLLKIHLFYPKSFAWVNDIVWQEDLSYAGQKVNQAGIFTFEGEQIWINPTLILR